MARRTTSREPVRQDGHEPATGLASWLRLRARRPNLCERCHGSEHVRRGICRRCRAELLAEATPGGAPPVVGTTDSRPPRAPSLEPPHSRPWLHRGGG